MSLKMKQLLPGIFLCFVIAVPSWFLGKAFPIIGGPVFGILFGMLIAFRPQNQIFHAGIKYTSKKLLQYSIILLGFEMNLFNVIVVGRQSLLVMLFTLSASFLTAYFVGRAMQLSGNTTVLIGVGTCICGGSAIAATAPVIRASDEDVAQAISTIFLFNIIAVFLFPFLGHLFNMSDIGFGMWAGTAINDTSSVVASGVSWSVSAGNNTALAFATIVKLTRTLMIVPITLVLAVYTARKAANTDRLASNSHQMLEAVREADEEIVLRESLEAIHDMDETEELVVETIQEEQNVSNYSITKIFPWFVLGFVAAAVLNTFAGIPEQVSGSLSLLGKFVIVMAMTAIGLNTNLKKLICNGAKPIGLGLCCWFMVAGVSLLVQHFMGLL